MKKTLVTAGLTLLVLLIFAGQAFASLAEESRAEAYTPARKAIFASGMVQVYLPGFNWSINSNAPDFKVWVWTNGLTAVSGKGCWHLLEKNEAIMQSNSVVRIKIDNNESYLVEMYGLIEAMNKEQDHLIIPSFGIGVQDIGLLLEDKWERNNSLKLQVTEKFSYELVVGKEAVTTSLKALAQYFFSNEISDKMLCGFVTQDSRGFLKEVIKIDYDRLERDQKYKDGLFEILSKKTIREDQFVVAIYEDWE